jgi:HEAT repeat protein
MPRQPGAEEILVKLREMERAPLTAEGREYLIKTLTATKGMTAARAAQMIGRMRNADFAPHLCAAFTRFIDRPELDKGCTAKEAICRALDAIGCSDTEILLRGVHHVQMEAVFGGRVDTAASLRVLCATALAEMLHPEAHLELAALLLDPDAGARRTAVRVVSSLGCERSELILRMKTLAGDTEPDIIGQCFTGLLAMETRRSVPFVARFLASDNPEIAGQAAVALGLSEYESAFHALRDCWVNNTNLGLTKSLILAIGLTRREEAFNLLLEVLTDGPRINALIALEALKIYASDPRRAKSIRETAESRGLEVDG